MRRLGIVTLLIGWLLHGWAGSAQTACDPQGDVKFVCGLTDPEDLVQVPDSPWVIVSNWVDEGQLYGADTRDDTVTVLFPAETSRPRHDTAMYGACPGPQIERFQSHGLSVRSGDGGVHTLYVVGHGDREAVEVFELDARGATPEVTWVGCAVAPDGVSLNSVASLPDGGFVATNWQFATGDVHEWHPDSGWEKIPGSDIEGPNGIVVSPDGRWLYIGGWGNNSLIRLSRGQTPVQTDTVELGFQVDNVHWAPDGTLFAAGQGSEGEATLMTCFGEGKCDGMTSRVVKVDPQSLSAEEIIRYPSNDLVVMGTAAIQVGDEIWMGSIGGSSRIARFAIP